MKILALEASTILASVAVIIDGQLAVEESSDRQRYHSEFLNPAVQSVLQKSNLKLQDINIFAVGKGPGSFTGIRVACNIGKSFAESLQKKMVAVDSLTLLAVEAGSNEPVLCMINAYKNMIYLAVIHNGNFLISPQAVKVLELEAFLSGYKISTPILCVGDGYIAYEKLFSPSLKSRLFRDSNFSDYPMAKTLGSIADLEAKNGQTIVWNLCIPLYIRASEAE